MTTPDEAEEAPADSTPPMADCEATGTCCTTCYNDFGSCCTHPQRPPLWTLETS